MKKIAGEAKEKALLVNHQLFFVSITRALFGRKELSCLGPSIKNGFLISELCHQV